ncbi:MAG: hypothetical protein J6P78_00705 [Lachnospiraceae bacterium]|nr:hypothetical protein [Lachnospiraceae bacterium]
MKITFEGQDNSQALKYIKNNTQGKQIQKGDMLSPESMSALVDIGNANTLQIPGEEGKHSLLAGAARDAAVQDSGVLKNYRVVMAHTMSGEDLRKAEEDGFDLGNMSPEESVTILDKVKAETAKGGTVIRGFNDDLDDAVLDTAGNRGLDSVVKKALAEQNLPATKENIREVSATVDLAAQLEVPTDSEKAYIIENDLSLAVRDFYVAQSAAPERPAQVSDPSILDTPEMKNIKESMIEAGRVLEDPEAGYEIAEWLFERNLPVTEENILKSRNISEIKFPVSAERAARAGARAIASGKSADMADLTEKGSVYEQAALIEAKYFSDAVLNTEDIAHTRKIQEIRLSMTAEVNLELVRSGFAIDTAPIEELIDRLKAIEQEVALKYFPETAGVTDHDDNAPGMSIGSPEDAVAAYRLMNAVNTAVTELGDAPASSLGVFVPRTGAEVAFGEFEEIALGEKERLRKAGESYEALSTEVRRDLGDSISKAFTSVDGLVEGRGLDLNDLNRRHVRILAYNRMEISIENIDRIAAADETVTSVIDKMKPAAVLDMIRNGINPLEKSFDEIGKFLDERIVNTDGFEKASENYAEFLYALDKTREITAEERETYIGIYRMLDKIEKKDGAAIGSVVNTESELDFANLLSAVRSAKFRGMDVRVDDGTGLSEVVSAGRSITDQIMASFREAPEGYYEDKAEHLRNAAFAGEDGLSFIEDAGVSVNAENIIAAENLLSADDDLYRTVFGKKEDEKLKKEADEALDRIVSAEEPDEEYADFLKEMRADVQTMTFEAGEVIDVRALQQVGRQLSVAVKAIEEGVEEYFIPVDIGGEISKVRVSFRGNEGSSSADITFNDTDGNECRAHLELWDRSVNGIVSADPGTELKKLLRAADIFTADLNNDGFDTSAGVKVIKADEAEKSNKYELSGKDAGVNRQEGAGRKELFRLSERFLKAVKESFHEDQL